MKSIFLLIVLPLSFLLMSANSDYITKGWFKAGSEPEKYKMGLDNEIVKSGKSSAFIKSNSSKIKGFGTLMQKCAVSEYIDKRIKLTGYIKTENVEEWCGLWLRIDGRGNKQMGFDNMGDRPLKGTMDWTKCEIVMDVPSESIFLNFGVLLSGTGQVWFDDLSFEIVGENTPVTTNEDRYVLPEPTNIDFEIKD